MKDDLDYACFLLHNDDPVAAAHFLQENVGMSLGRAIILLDHPSLRGDALEQLRVISHDLGSLTIARTVATMLLIVSGDAQEHAAALDWFLQGMGEPGRETTREDKLINPDVPLYPGKTLEELNGTQLLLSGLKRTSCGEREEALRCFALGKDEPSSFYTIYPGIHDLLYLVMNKNPHWPLPIQQETDDR
jgi:hypothetical protein